METKKIVKKASRGRPKKQDVSKAEPPKRTPEPTAIGSTGLCRAGGWINEEFLVRLRGKRGVETFKEMSQNDATIGAILFAVESLVRQVKWRARPANETEEAIEWARFLESTTEDMATTWEDFMSEILSMLWAGWAYFETTMKKRDGEKANPLKSSNFDDGLIGYKDISIRSQDTLWKWEFAEDSRVLGLWQMAPPKWKPVFIPMERSILFRIKTHKNNPEGQMGGILRNAYRSWFFVKRLQELEAISFERNLIGLPVMEVPIEILSQSATGESASIRGMLENMIQEIKMDERMGALVPSELDRDGNPTGYKLKSLDGGSGKTEALGIAIKRYQTDMAMSVLAQFLMLGTTVKGSSGSFALASSQTEMFAIALGAIIKNIRETLNRCYIPKIFKVNQVPRELWPRFEHGDIEKHSLSEVADYVSKLAGAGAITVDADLERRLREIGRLPQTDRALEV
jgi:hypothetical protein